jgi:parvulin-like peptidyl-prolyl isomerase
LLREPLLHFLLLGLALFLLYGRVSTGDDDRHIVVSQAQVDDLAAQHQKLWGRAPTPAELNGLVETFVRDEILYREGVALGLDQDDAVVKRRVRQKLEVLAEEEIARGAPTDAELSAYLASDPKRFTQPGIVTFEQVLFDSATASAELSRALAAARRGADVATLGRATMLPSRVASMPLDLVARDFGSAFAAQLERLPLNEWTGPVASTFGVHLVRLSARTPPVLPPLDAVRDVVTREWENARRERALAESYKRLREEYDVEIEADLPAAASAGS